MLTSNLYTKQVLKIHPETGTTFYTYFKELSTKLCPNLKAAVAKTFVIDGFTLSSYCLLNPESAGFI